jgi:hypothetical protein
LLAQQPEHVGESVGFAAERDALNAVFVHAGHSGAAATTARWAERAHCLVVDEGGAGQAKVHQSTYGLIGIGLGSGQRFYLLTKNAWSRVKPARG